MSIYGNKDLKSLTGTSIGVTQYSTAVTGSGTAFTTELKAGQAIVISGVAYKIYKIVSDTSVTLASKYLGTTNATINIVGSAVTAGSFVIGTTYKISSAGTTDFTLIGATNSTLGTVFTATGIGTGTGQATPFNVHAQTIPTSLVVADLVTAGSFSKAKTYKIAALGTTDFTLIGASANTVGLKFIATGPGTGSGTAYSYKPEQDLTNVVFVSKEEAALASNKKKGIHGAGWWRLFTYVNAEGNTRYKAELIQEQSTSQSVSFESAATNEDLIAADTNPVITINTHPSNQNTSGGAATFSVSASVSVVSPVATITYQWQKAVAGSTRFVNVSGATSSSLVLSAQTSANTGDRYRVVINTAPNGIAAVTSNAATLTFVS